MRAAWVRPAFVGATLSIVLALVPVSAVATCFDMIQNGDETDIDCGGTCPDHCADGQRCISASDCNFRCDSGICRSCFDKLQTDGETDVDCGGPCPDRCPDGQGCISPSDCASGVCCAANHACSSGMCPPTATPTATPTVTPTSTPTVTPTRTLSFQETSGGAGFCGDGLDNDGNGLTDCADPSCHDAPECPQTVPTLSWSGIAAAALLVAAVGLLALRSQRMLRT